MADADVDDVDDIDDADADGDSGNTDIVADIASDYFEDYVKQYNLNFIPVDKTPNDKKVIKKIKALKT